jgi:HK97 family phage prohead protease
MRIEIRGNQVLLDGYVNAVGRESRVLPSSRGPFKEQILPGTFERALQRTDNVDLRFNHDENRTLGSLKDGSLQLWEDNIGLRAIATVTDEEVMKKAKDGKLTGWSFGFIDQKPNWQDGSDGIQRRFLEDITLLEVSILDKVPAYIATSIEARGEDNVITESRSDEFRAMTEEMTSQDTMVCSQCGNEQTMKKSDYEKQQQNRSYDFSLYEKEIDILKLRGGK